FSSSLHPPPAPTPIYTLSLHDALPISGQQLSQLSVNGRGIYQLAALTPGGSSQINALAPNVPVGGDAGVEFNGMRQNHNIYLLRSEEHTSELQSLRHLVCRLLLEKKKK